ncbi:MAG: hypothetical protein Q8J74_02845 [Candidatus Didemnitutus sp.]|nr:hypothetical protein [Candidatus Didemnitutus sp.]
MRLPARLYQQFDADPGLPVPAESYGGWQSHAIDLSPAHTALVVMHAWDPNQPGQFPGWDRVVEYRPRARRILADVFPPLLAAVRRSPLPVFHVVGGGRDYFRHLPGHRRAVALAGPEPVPTPVSPDPAFDRLQALRRAHSFPGLRNAAEVAAGFAQLDFAPTARPVGDEGIAENAHQLAALCRAHGVNHLVYIGFAINWCLLMSPGGMVDMARQGCLCSTIAEAVTAVENRETAAEELEKQQALWRVALEFGFVFTGADFIHALPAGTPTSPLP